MKLLGLDTATPTASVAVSHGAAILERRRLVTTHSEMLLPLVDELLRASHLAPADLDGVACGAGPGSFTGLRIGLATAKGLCYALGRPLVLVSSLEALAARAPAGSRVVAVLDAYRGDVYAGWFDVDDAGLPHRLEDECALAPALLAERMRREAFTQRVVLVGDGARKHPVLAVDGVSRLDEDPGPRATEVLRLAQPRFVSGAVDDLAASVPHYLRASEAERKRHGGG